MSAKICGLVKINIKQASYNSNFETVDFNSCSTRAFLFQTTFSIVNYVNDTIPWNWRLKRFCNNAIIQPDILEINLKKKKNELLNIKDLLIIRQKMAITLM